MFGHDNNDHDDNTDTPATDENTSVASVDNAQVIAPDAGAGSNSMSPPEPMTDTVTDDQPSGSPATPFLVTDEPAATTDSPTSEPETTPVVENIASENETPTPPPSDEVVMDTSDTSASTTDAGATATDPSDAAEDTIDTSTTPEASTSTDTSNDLLAGVPSMTGGSTSDALLDIKQEALKQLSPLVGQLNQTPEEKFRTLMMMIQASDDENLVQGAYEAAEAITDEKTRAQALLDIINEINYFTQQHNS
jgi:hypothetical protein